jgi:hypothetical protein
MVHISFIHIYQHVHVQVLGIQIDIEKEHDDLL